MTPQTRSQPPRTKTSHTQMDYVLRVVARDGLDYDHILKRLGQLPAVEHLHTHVVLHEVLRREALKP